MPSPTLPVAHSTYDMAAFDDEESPPFLLLFLLPPKPKPRFLMSFRILFPSFFLIRSEADDPADAADALDTTDGGWGGLLPPVTAYGWCEWCDCRPADDAAVMPAVVREPLSADDCCDECLLDEVRCGRGGELPSLADRPVFSPPLTISPELRTILVPISCRLLAEDAAAAETGIAFGLFRPGSCNISSLNHDLSRRMFRDLRFPPLSGLPCSQARTSFSGPGG